MARIETQKGRYRYPTGAGASPMPVGAMGAEEGAIAEFAELGGLIATREGQRIMRADQKAQTIAGIAEISKRMNETFDSFDTNPDESTYGESFKKTMTGFADVISSTTNRKSKIDLEQYIQTSRPRLEGALRDVILKRKRVNTYARRDQLLGKINDYDLSNPGERLEAEGLVGAAGDLMRELGHSTVEVENWTANALKVVDNQAIYQEAENIAIEEGYQKAVGFVASQKIDVEDRNKILSNLASTERIQATRHKQERENTMRTMLADVWDGKLKDPEAVTNALRAGYLDDTDAKYLRDAIMNPDPPKTTNEALIAVRYAIAGIAEGTETRESALKKLIAYTEQLNPADGKAFIKEIFGEHDTKNAFWNRQAQEYMEQQIMNVASLTGILYGSGEQLALSAQALMSYDEAKKAAIADGKPLNGSELLELAHQVMLPFREKVKPLISGERVPGALKGRLVGKTTAKTPELKRKEITTTEKKTSIYNYPTPKNFKEFDNTISHIPEDEMKTYYFETMIRRITDEALAKQLYDKWVDKLYK